MLDHKDGLPEWSAKGQTGGLDPLAMLAPIEGVYTSLLVGMSSVTVRIRYYSFLAWWLVEYANGGFSTDRDVFDAHIRKGEALVGLVSRANRNNQIAAGGMTGGVAGDNTFGAVIGADPVDVDMVLLRESYLKTPAFIAVYGPQMAEMGILQRNTSGMLAPSPDIGKPLAAAFEQTIGAKTAKRFRKWAQKDTVPRKALKKMRSMDINFTNTIADDPERSILRNAFIGREGLGDRHGTLLEILKFAQYHDGSLTDRDIRFGWLETLPEKNHRHYTERLAWQHFQIADSIRVALESILRHCVQHLAGTGPVPLPELVAQVCADLPTDLSLAEFAETLADQNQNFDTRNLQDQAEKDSATLDEKLALLFHIWRMWGDRLAEMDEIIPPRNHHNTSGTEIRFLTNNENEPARSTIARMIRDRILTRHLSIAARKLRFQGNYTYQFEYEDGNIIARQTGSVGAAGPRIATAINFLTQLGFIDNDGITKLGLSEVQEI
jgi:hypothetical protein